MDSSYKMDSLLDEAKNFIPIVISLQYENKFLKFQINPERIKKHIPSESITADVQGIGQVSVPTKPKLSTITLSSFFWQDRNVTPSYFYVSWLKKWQASKKPAKLIVTRLNYSMYVTCESFDYESRAGEENDIYYTLQLQEYRPHGVQVYTPKPNKSKLDLIGVLDDIGDFVPPILVDMPRVSRYQNNKVVKNPYKTKENDTLLSITKEIRNSTSEWKELYDMNKDVLADNLAMDKPIPAGTKLKLPKGWKGIKGFVGDYTPWERYK